MKNPFPSYRISPLGDTALIIDFGNFISPEINEAVISLFKTLGQSPLEYMTEAVPAYSSLAIYYDVVSLYKRIKQGRSAFDQMKKETEKLLSGEGFISGSPGELISIPVCYDEEYGVDLRWISIEKNIPVKEIIRLHTLKTYRVYMLGFLPGFAYMGDVDERIASPRKLQPSPVKAGSVGIAGKQTGIYPMGSPGGWQVIGRTPLKLFNKYRERTTLLRAGDHVNFFSISKDEFEDIKSRNT